MKKRPYHQRCSISQLCIEEDVPYEPVLYHRRRHGTTVLEAIEAVRARQIEQDRREAYIEIARQNGISPRQFYLRYHCHGMSYEEAATRPLRKYRGRR